MTEIALAENPLAEGLRMRRLPEPFALTIFGASGDLTQRKLMPALYSLAFRGLLPDEYGIVGVARTQMTTDEFRERMRQAIVDHGREELRDDVWEPLAERLCYVAADFGAEGERAGADRLPERSRRDARHRRKPRLLPRRAADGVRARSSPPSARCGRRRAGPA